VNNGRATWLLILAALLAGCAGAGGYTGPSGNNKTKEAAKLQVQMAQEYLKKGNLEVARDKLLRALELDPYSPDAHTVSGLLNDTIGDPIQAEIHYRRAVELLPKDGGMNNNFASYLCRQGRYAEADVLFQRAVADPYYKTPEAALANAGVCAERAGQLEQAEVYLRRALDRNPDYPGALEPMASVLFARGDFLRARAFVQRFDASEAASAQMLLLGMKVEQALGDERSADDYKRRLLSAFPRSQEAQSLEARE
jgi:type IV pilus assembly protein PilF